MINFREYLLGNLPPTDTEAIDIQIIADENSEEQLLWAESELMEDYLDKTLSPKEIELFEKNFLVSPERRTHLKQISLLRDYAHRSATADVSENICDSEPLGWLERLRNLFSLAWRPTAVVFAAVIVFAVGIFYFTADRQTAEEKAYAEINQKDSSDLAEFKNIPTVNLISGNFRGAGGVSKVSADNSGDKVLFRLALPLTANAPDSFRAELVSNDKITFTQKSLRFYNNPNGQEIRLLLPSAALKKGTYQIKLSKEAAPDSVFIYSFAVE